ncbi:MAG: protein phosphatase 2C domain-containing protein [Desulfosalsimonas sp.]|uniref:PP2C family protein-serine/threonine phosphatase n=1 Tax=Desulfosalsimonas sp. TaxID=3073848 RepID=UPI00397091F2
MMIGPRHRQEDCIVDGQSLFQADLLSRRNSFSTDTLLLAVCDGMGGHQGGAEASQFTCRQIESHNWTNGISRQAVRDALNTIQARAEKDLPLHCGTTIAGLLCDGMTAIVFNAGDSRVYRFHSDFIEYVSHDHSLVQDLVDQKMVNAEKAATHPYKHLIEFGIGPVFSQVWPQRKVYTDQHPVNGSATYLICSDGLTDIFPDSQIHQLLGPEPIKNGARLANAARRKGLTDNTSFIIARIEE